VSEADTIYIVSAFDTPSVKWLVIDNERYSVPRRARAFFVATTCGRPPTYTVDAAGLFRWGKAEVARRSPLSAIWYRG
jgi:hypothetical protein